MGYSTSPEGHQVCRQAWFHLMGAGKMRMARCKRTFHGQDKRMIGGHGGPHSHPAEKTALCKAFFIHIYWSAGETMTTSDAPKSMLEANDDDMREDLFQRLIDAKLMGPTMQLSNTDPGNLPTRELPHGNVAELYMVFVAFCGNKTPASRACFYKEAKRWKQCLRFRRPLAHSLCKTCSQLQAALSNATDFLQHAKIADRLLGHYCQQWKNRESYWLARSRAQQVGDPCCMMIDSYDKAKCMLPKFPRGRTPKQVIYESVKRTSLTLTCSLIHGFGVYIYLADEGLPCGANWTIEVVTCLVLS
ncbi:unnamed protein product [Cladocopium goreaui]|uniref:Uncharacterized protein n=1 Tax=Cladocopium goreaui TaxID=2562237 RepID=A0A9P1FE59_9DINO|nr:unnamed protein product [Cladocopium goreaui]